METGKHKGTEDWNDPDDLEVLCFTPSWHDYGVISQTIASAPLSNKELSLIVSKRYGNEPVSRFIRLILTEEECDMIVDSIVEAKKRWNDGKVIDK